MDLQTLSDEEFRLMITGVESEKRRRADEESRVLAENRASMMFHEELNRSVQRVRGLPVWQRPTMAVTGYYSGSTVWHDGYGWQNISPGVALEEPGTLECGWVTFEDSGIGYPEPLEGEVELPEEVESLPLDEALEPEEETDGSENPS